MSGGMDRPAGMPPEVFYDGKPWTDEANRLWQEEIAGKTEYPTIVVTDEKRRECVKRLLACARGLGMEMKNTTANKPFAAALGLNEHSLAAAIKGAK